MGWPGDLSLIAICYNYNNAIGGTMNILFLVTAFVLGYISCYIFMTAGVRQDND